MSSSRLKQKLERSADSPSLWNCTLAPGWSREELEILRKAIMKFGVGSWAKIVASGCLPGKTPAQLNLQTQRMLGQQSLGGFYGVHLDPVRVWHDNKAIDGVRKNGCLINTGNNPNKEERLKQIEANKKKYGLPQEVIDSIELAPPEHPSHAEILEDPKQQKKAKLKRLKNTLAYMESRLQKLLQEQSEHGEEQQPQPEKEQTEKTEKSDAVPEKPKQKTQQRASSSSRTGRSQRKEPKEFHEYNSEEDLEDFLMDSDSDSDFETNKKKKKKKGTGGSRRKSKRSRTS